jgi:hypothetical protein
VSIPVIPRWLAAAGVVISVAMALPANAPADGDPASDVLLFQDIFLPYATPSPEVSAQLGGAVAAAKKAGLPLKVAVVQSPADLGSVGALFNQPQRYATFLSQELSLQDRRVLIVMPGGYGIGASGGTRIVNRNGTTEIVRVRVKLTRELAALKRLPPPTSPDADALTKAATEAVRAVAEATGHPLPATITPVPVGTPGGGVHNGAASTPTSGGSSSGGGISTGVLDVLSGLGVALVLVLVLTVVSAVRSRHLEGEQDDEHDGGHPDEQGGESG